MSADVFRYYIQSEHVRGERRVYYVCDRQKATRLSDGQCTHDYTSKIAAQKQCDKLNRAKP